MWTYENIDIDNYMFWLFVSKTQARGWIKIGSTSLCQFYCFCFVFERDFCKGLLCMILRIKKHNKSLWWIYMYSNKVLQKEHGRVTTWPEIMTVQLTGQRRDGQQFSVCSYEKFQVRYKSLYIMPTKSTIMICTASLWLTPSPFPPSVDPAFDTYFFFNPKIGIIKSILPRDNSLLSLI